LIRDAVGDGKVEKWLLQVDEAGKVTKKTLDAFGNVIPNSLKKSE
jgi:hypothetical protein